MADMTAPPAGALEACLAQEIRRVDGDHTLGAAALAEALMPFLADRLAALRLREGCEGLVARTRAEASADILACLDDAGGYKSPSHRAGWNFAHGRASTADDLARVLEESATGDEAASD